MQLTNYNANSIGNCRQSHSVNFFDGIFDDFWGPAYLLERNNRTTSRSSLNIDIFLKENVIVIEADLPGVNKEDIKLDVKGKYITLGGERKQQEEIQDEHRYRRERSFGSFERTFSLPFEIDADSVTAKLENGTLRLEIPKPEEKKSKKIAIN